MALAASASIQVIFKRRLVPSFQCLSSIKQSHCHTFDKLPLQMIETYLKVVPSYSTACGMIKSWPEHF